MVNFLARHMLYVIARISTYWSKKMTKLLAALATTLAFTSVQAATIVLDDFSTNQGPISDLTSLAGPGGGSNGAVCDNNGSRTICSDLIAAAPPVQQTTGVSFGVYDVANGSGENSIQTITWVLPATPALIGATNQKFLFSVIQSDANPVQLDFTYNGRSLTPYAIPANTINSNVSFNAPVSFAPGGTLVLRITGTAGWDLTLDSFGLSFDPAVVPAPALPLLIGVGMIGLALRRKMK
jgi:hypothetical protein